MNELATAAEDSIWNPFSFTTDSLYLTNGCNTVSLHVKAGYWTRVRTAVHAISGDFLVNFFGDGNNGHRCNIGVLAKDGVYLDRIPRTLSSPGILVSDSGRVDVVIKCPEEWVGDYALPITLLKYPEPNDAKPISQRIGTLVVSSTTIAHAGGGHDADILELPVWKPCRPFYLADLTKFLTDQLDTDIIMVNEMGINGELYDPEKYQRHLREGQVLQWSLESNMNTNLHVNTNKMQIVSGPSNPYYAPEWDQVGDWIDMARIRSMTQSSDHLDNSGSMHLQSDPNLVVRLVLDRWGGGMEIQSQNYFIADSGVKAQYLIEGGQSTVSAIAVLRYGTCIPPSPRPFGRGEFPAPGVLEPANFDEGGIHVGYGYYNGTNADVSGDFLLTQKVRQETAVHVHDSADVQHGGAYEVVGLSAGDWLAYSFKINTTDTYKFGVRMRSSFGMLTIKLDLGDCASREGFVDEIQQLEFGGRGTKEDYQSLIGLRKVEIPAGMHRLFLCVSIGDDISLSTISILNAA